jgi:hypothetical protein
MGGRLPSRGAQDCGAEYWKVASREDFRSEVFRKEIEGELSSPSSSVSGSQQQDRVSSIDPSCKSRDRRFVWGGVENLETILWAFWWAPGGPL